jgi:hypothetical protein
MGKWPLTVRDEMAYEKDIPWAFHYSPKGGLTAGVPGLDYLQIGRGLGP